MSAHRYSDAYLHHWGEVFTRNSIVRDWYVRRGLGDVAFLSFLAAPEEILHAIVYGTPMPLDAAAECYPLLPAQERVRLRLILAEITLPRPAAQVAA